MFERPLRPSLHLGLAVREAALLESSSRALSEALSHAMWLLSGLLGFVRLQGFSPLDAPLFNTLVSSLSKCLAHQASISASHTAFVSLKRRQFYLSHLAVYFTDVHKRAMMAAPIVCADSLFLESDISRLLSDTQTSSSLRSQQALVDVTSNQLQPQFHQGAGGVRCGVRLSGEGGHRDRPSFSGVLQSPFCHSQRHRGLATGHRSLTPQQLGGALQFSHGDCSVRSPVSPSGGLDGIPGSPGSGSSSFLPLPEVLRGRCGVLVSSPVLRPFFSPSGVHPRHGSCFVHNASPRFSSSPLPGRLASPGLHLPGTSASEELPPLTVSSPRRHSKSFEELFGPDSDSGLSWDDAQDFSFEGFPDPQKGPEVLSPSRFLVRPPPSCVCLEESSRDDVVNVDHCSRLMSPHAFSPASP